METALLLGIVALCGAAMYWVYRGVRSEAREEAYSESNDALNKRAKDLNDALLEGAARDAREDRRSAEEIIRGRDADGARGMLRDATRDDLN